METINLSNWAREAECELRTTRTPIEGSLELTRRCNFTCPHCYCPPSTAKNELNAARIDELLDELVDAGCLWLTITGGEPLIRPDFFDLYEKSVSKGLLVTVFSNGLLLDEKALSRFDDMPPLGIEVSIYGMDESSYRCTTGQGDVWPRVKSNIEKMTKLKIPFSLKTVATKRTAAQVPQIARWASELGVKFRFDPSLNPMLNGNSAPTAERLSPAKVLELESFFPKRKKAWQDLCALPFEPDCSETGLKCSAGKNSFYITCEGVLTPCVMFPGETGASLIDRSFEQAWREIGEMAAKLPENKECAKCPEAMACEACQAWSMLENGNWSGIPKYVCELAKARAQAFGAAP